MFGRRQNAEFKQDGLLHALTFDSGRKCRGSMINRRSVSVNVLGSSSRTYLDALIPDDVRGIGRKARACIQPGRTFYLVIAYLAVRPGRFLVPGARSYYARNQWGIKTDRSRAVRLNRYYNCRYADFQSKQNILMRLFSSSWRRALLFFGPRSLYLICSPYMKPAYR